MKKLMMLAAAMTIVGSAFAQVAANPAVSVFDYKASVKNTDLKIVKVKIANLGTVEIVTKILVSNQFTGYIIAEDCDSCVNDPAGTGDAVAVLVRKGDKTKKPYVLPATLKMVNAFDKTGKLVAGVATKTFEVEGGLWIGDDTLFAQGEPTLFTGDPMPARYSEGLFGINNVQDQNLHTFFDAWLDASGFGKGSFCAGINTPCIWGAATPKVDTLSGSVIGGIYLCLDPGLSICTDGDVEGTSFVNAWVTGTWSIKRNTKAPTNYDILDDYIWDAVDALNDDYWWNYNTSTVQD